MTKPPESVDPQSAPALAALQDLKYQEDTPHSQFLPHHSHLHLYIYHWLGYTGRALAHKEDGNEQYKKRRYKQAIQCYTEGLSQGCKDSSVISVLLGNRATSHYYLGWFLEDWHRGLAGLPCR